MVSYYRKDDMGIIEFNDPDSKVNLLSAENLDALERIIGSVIENDRHIKALFFISGKQDIFIAGADIKELAAICTKAEAIQICKRGQDLFDKIEQLTMPTIAVVSGACVGGGLELALSCDCILATKNKKVRMGLPEKRLGITPGFGGPHRLAERIGAKEAGHLIATGRLLSGKEALLFNLVDDIIPESKKFLYKKLIKVYRRRGICAKRSARGNGERAGLNQAEREVLAEKIFQEPARNSLASYLLVSKYRNYPWPESASGTPRPTIKRSAIIGAGTMGRGIAYLVSSQGGLPVGLTDLDRHTLKKARPRIKAIYGEAVKKDILYKNEARVRFGNITFGKADLAHADIVLESITEDASLKEALFAEVEPRLRKDCILATNASCLSVQGLSKSLARAERFIGMHFFNPAYKMKLVEVVPTRFTSREVLQAAVAFLQRLKRIPVIVKDSPGFLVNRMLLPYLNEAVFMLEEGVLAEDIDRAMLEFGMPMGPLRLLGEIGLDVAYKASKALEDSYGNRMKVPETLKACPEEILEPQRTGRSHRDFEYITGRLLSPIKREAVLCLEERVVDDREIIDLALLLGIGFPASKRIWHHKKCLTSA